MKQTSDNPMLSIIVPVYNERENIPELYRALRAVLADSTLSHELIFVNDGSTDSSSRVMWEIADTDPSVRVIEFSRNFGKEIATTAGLHAAKGDAAIMIDADLQHPVNLLPEFVAKWQAGAEVVIGIRKTYGSESLSKKLYSWLFYKMLNSIAEMKVKPHATDYRLVDREVIDAFKQFSERNRMTRGLIDWLGFDREYIEFDINPRQHGAASYNFRKLLTLAANSFVGLSLFPLRLAGYMGVIITTLASLLGLFVLIEQGIMHDPLGLRITGTARLGDINIILIGIVLMALGLVSLYIANIHDEVINRPLYIVRKTRSRRK